MILLSNEDELLSSHDGKVILTNQRIHMNDTVWGNSYNITMFLEDISSIEMRYSSNIIMIILAVVMGLCCMYLFAVGNDGGAWWCFILTVSFLLFYWLSRRHIVSITPNGGKALNFEVTKLSEGEMESFLAKVQEAKLQRKHNLGGLQAAQR